MFVEPHFFFYYFFYFILFYFILFFSLLHLAISNALWPLVQWVRLQSLRNSFILLPARLTLSYVFNKITTSQENNFSTFCEVAGQLSYISLRGRTNPHPHPPPFWGRYKARSLFLGFCSISSAIALRWSLKFSRVCLWLPATTPFNPISITFILTLFPPPLRLGLLSWSPRRPPFSLFGFGESFLALRRWGPGSV